MKTITTRRIIKPAAGVQPAVIMPSSAAVPALIPKTTLWSSWLDRFAALDRQAGGLTTEVERSRNGPRQPDLAEARRLQDTYLTPWTALQDTFEAAAGDGIAEALRADYRAYLDVRLALIRALVRRQLAPSVSAVGQVDAAAAAVQRFIDARRSGG